MIWHHAHAHTARNYWPWLSTSQADRRQSIGDNILRGSGFGTPQGWNAAVSRVPSFLVAAAADRARGTVRAGLERGGIAGVGLGSTAVD